MRCGKFGSFSFICSRKFNQRMIITKFQAKDGVTKVVPVNDEMGIANETDDLCYEKCWNRGRILYCINVLL